MTMVALRWLHSSWSAPLALVSILCLIATTTTVECFCVSPLAHRYDHVDVGAGIYKKYALTPAGLPVAKRQGKNRRIVHSRTVRRSRTAATNGFNLQLTPFPEGENKLEPLLWAVSAVSAGVPDETENMDQNETSPLDMLPVELVEQRRVMVMPDNTSAGWGRFLVLVAAAVYGTNFATVKMLDDVMPLAVSAALRFSLAAMAVSSFVMYRELQQTQSAAAAATDSTMVLLDVEQQVLENENLLLGQQAEAEERWLATRAGMEIGLWYCAGYIFQAMALLTAGASKVSFYSALAVIVVPLLDSFISGKQLEKETVVSVAIATAGVALLQLGPPVGGATMSITMGDLFCLGQTLFFGIGYWRLEKVSKKFPTQASRNTVGQLVALAGGSIAYCLLAGGGVPPLSELQEWLVNPFIIKALLWTGLVSTALALYLETVAMEFVSASELTILMTSVSLWGSAFAFIAMGEVLSPAGMVGGLMILAGCVVSSTKATPKEEEDGKDRENSIPEINNVY